MLQIRYIKITSIMMLIVITLIYLVLQFDYHIYLIRLYNNNDYEAKVHNNNNHYILYKWITYFNMNWNKI